MQLLAKELGRLMDLHIATHRSANPLPIENSTIHYLKGNALGWGMKRDWLSLLDEMKPDVVHVNCCWMPEIALAQRWAQQRGYKVVLTPHGMLEPWIMRRHYWTRKVPALLLYQKAAVRRANMIHATAESEKENLLKLGWNKKISIIPNGIDVEAIEMKRSWRRTGKILFLSRVHPKKGINFLIEAAALLKGTRKDLGRKVTQISQMDTDMYNRRNASNEKSVGICDICVTKYKFIIAGESYGDYVEELKQFAEDKGVSDMFEFVGGVYGDKKWELYREADLFVLPTHSENFGIVVAEALASGTPVITTKGTPWQELQSRRCGWWTEIGAEPIAKTIQEFLSHSETDLELMGRNGRKLVEEKYSARSVAKEMAEMYKGLSHTDFTD